MYQGKSVSFTKIKLIDGKISLRQQWLDKINVVAIFGDMRSLEHDVIGSGQINGSTTMPIKRHRGPQGRLVCIIDKTKFKLLPVVKWVYESSELHGFSSVSTTQISLSSSSLCTSSALSRW